MDEDTKKLLEELRTDVKTILERLGSLRGQVTVISAIVSAVVAGAVLALLTGCAASPPSLAPGVYPDGAASAVVGLVDEDGYAYCTGTNTDRGVLTAAHCVEGADRVALGTLAGLDPDRTQWTTTHTVRVLWADPVIDMALLEGLPDRLAGRLSVRRLDPVLGEPVLVIGHGGRVPYTHHAGRVGRAASPCMPGWGCVLWFDADVRATPGNSGSAILDARGDVIGVLSFSVGPNITGAIPASLLPSRTPG